jgi:very-short-patch-repair endonuclease
MINRLYRTHSIGCACGDGVSYPNKFMYNLLTQLKVKFISEYTPVWVKPKLYDFYIPSLNLIIEMDGYFHSNYNNMNGQSKEESKSIDNQKDQLAKQHNIKMIRIDCDYKSSNRFDYIKENILNSELLEYFNLKYIDWIKIEKFTASNLVKEVCKIKNDNPNIITREICELVGLKKCCVIKYLKQGTKLGWCYYNPKDEQEKSNIKRGEFLKQITSKKVEIFIDDKSLGIFESENELARKSECLFGIKLDSKNISATLHGKQRTHKGFTFQFV